MLEEDDLFKDFQILTLSQGFPDFTRESLLSYDAFTLERENWTSWSDICFLKQSTPMAMIRTLNGRVGIARPSLMDPLWRIRTTGLSFLNIFFSLLLNICRFSLSPWRAWLNSCFYHLDKSRPINQKILEKEAKCYIVRLSWLQFSNLSFPKITFFKFLGNLIEV